MRLTGKGITLEQVREAFRWTKDAGIKAKAYFMIGHPWDTKVTIKRTIKFSTEIPADYVHFAIVTPFPGTKLWKIATERRVIDPQNVNWDNFVLTGEYLPVRPIPLSEELSRDELNTWVKKAYSENELIRKILIKKLGKIGIFVWYTSKIIRRIKPLKQIGKIILSKIGWI